MPRAESRNFEAIRAELVADRDRLEAEREAVLAGLADVIRDSAPGSGDDPADASGKTFGREHEQALLTRVTDAVRATQDALDRIEAGTYGVCESCLQPIALPRLEAFPRAALCVSCKQKQERR